MKNNNNLMFKCLFPLLAFGILIASGCNKDDDDTGGDPQELITTVLLEFSPASGTPLTFSFKDVDGIGGNAPLVDNIALAANTTYTLRVKFLDESQAGNVEDITAEVSGESAVHLVCFGAEGGVPLPAVQDTDTNGKPLGLVSQVVTTAAGTGKLTVSLKHEPDKGAAAPCNTGETDVEVIFYVTIL
jgi:hypothetical protein